MTYDKDVKADYDEYLNNLTKIFFECARLLRPNGKIAINTPIMPIPKSLIKQDLRHLKDISADITDRHVIIVEDIDDTGLSLNFLKHRMEEASPKSLKFVTCLYKPEVAKLDFDIDWIGFTIDKRYLVGYGLDLKQIFRGLPGIYAINI